MIKVKIERAGDNVFYVQGGVTVQYAGEDDAILEVLDEDDAVIAVFRNWVYGLPITDEEYLVETGQADPEEDQEDDEDDEDDEGEADFIAPEPSPLVQANSHGTYGLVDEAEQTS
jgi:hypothetical protein